MEYVLRLGGVERARLERGGCVRLGRHPTNDVVVDDPTVSRFHARLGWADTTRPRPVLEDLGSFNGTLLDGRRVWRAPINERATVVLGDVPVELELVHPALIADDGRLECRLFNDVSRAAERGSLGDTRTVRDLLLDLERRARTGTLLLRRASGEARLTFAAGWVVDLRVDGAPCPLEVDSLARFEGAGFELRPDVEPCEGSMRVSARDLFGRGARRTARLSDGPLPAHLEVVQPDAAELERLGGGSAVPTDDGPFFGTSRPERDRLRRTWSREAPGRPEAR